MITLENVSFAYERAEQWALLDISMEIPEGAIFAVMGANGSGKTSFCRLFNGLIPHSIQGAFKGRVIIDGTCVESASVPIMATKVGMVFDDPQSQLFTAKVFDEVAFALENLRMDPDAIKDKALWALDAVGLSSYADYAPSALSGGQKQRLALAAALAMAEKILVMDEPSSQLDPAGAQDLLSLVMELRKKQGLTVIMATGCADEAARCADTVCVLSKGRLAACDTPERIFSDRALLDSYSIARPQVSQCAFHMADLGYPLARVPFKLDQAAALITEWHNAR